MLTTAAVQTLDETLSTATNLGTLQGIKAFSDYVGFADPTDYYQFSLSRSSNLNIALTNLQADVDLRLFLDGDRNGTLDAGELIQQSVRGGTADESINLATLPAGVYYIQVSTQGNEGTAYSLHLSDSRPSELLPAETNLGTLTGTASQVDWVGTNDTTDTYRFSLNTSTAFSATLTGYSSAVELRLIRDLNGNGVIDEGEDFRRSQQDSSAESIAIDALGIGTYFLQVNQSTGNTSYRLTLSALSSSQDPAGNTLATAQDIGVLDTPPNDNRTFNDAVGITDIDDYYRFSLTAASDVSLALAPLQSDADLELIQDRNGNGIVDLDDVIAGSYQSDRQIEHLRLALKSGTYFVHVFPYQGDTRYTLTLDATPLNLPTDYSLDYGNGLVNAAAAVARSLGQTPFSAVPDLPDPGWGLNQINAPEVWAHGYTGQGIVVAVVDSGVDYTHPDLQNAIWVNPSEIPGNGIDDDHNGFIDDIRGWDFVDNDNTPTDFNSHGTHVAGIIAADLNSFGVTGVAYGAKIMPVRVLDIGNGGQDQDVANGIRYAADNGAKVINLSLGGAYSQDIADAIRDASDQGVVVVMAAGNDSETNPSFPASLSTQVGIAVGAVDRTSTLANFSNRAGIPLRNYVVAPGVAVYSTTPNNTYQIKSGTSMSTPFVAGVAALILSANPTLSPMEVIRILVDTASTQELKA